MSKFAAGYLITSVKVPAYDPDVLGLRGQALLTGTTGVVSVKSCPNFPPCLAEPMPDISRMVPLLAKAEPIRNDSNGPVITNVRREKYY